MTEFPSTQRATGHRHADSALRVDSESEELNCNVEGYSWRA